jgi:hypothetical protein
MVIADVACVLCLSRSYQMTGGVVGQVYGAVIVCYGHNKHLKCSEGDIRLHIIGTEQAQTGMNLFPHVNHSCSRTETEQN